MKKLGYLLLLAALVVVPTTVAKAGYTTDCPAGTHFVDGHWTGGIWPHVHFEPAHCEANEAPAPTDVCPNIAGTQATIPAGKEMIDGQCVDIVVTPPTDVCPNIDGIQTSLPDGKVVVGGQCVDVTPPPVTCESGFHVVANECVQDEQPPLTCDTGFHVADNACVADEVTPTEPPTCSDSQHLESNVCVDNTVTPPDDTTPPSDTTPPPATGNGSHGGGAQGGHRHCIDTTTGRYCPPGVTDDQQPANLQSLIDQLNDLIKQLMTQLHDFKG